MGFNHHRVTIIFGATLMYNETTDSFIWLFETFFKAMCGKSPKTIFIDQDVAMANAISHIMPNTNRRLCTWHIMQNALKQVNSVFKGLGGVKSALSMLMESIKEEYELLSAWNAVLEEYDVRDNNWLK